MWKRDGEEECCMTLAGLLHQSEKDILAELCVSLSTSLHHLCYSLSLSLSLRSEVMDYNRFPGPPHQPGFLHATAGSR